ncbi:MAG TPA: hypothetical protein VG937_24065 [Polyangiaceae bacterium]|nr:hypothetical protein [Polyangiaceae bacterium]
MLLVFGCSKSKDSGEPSKADIEAAAARLAQREHELAELAKRARPAPSVVLNGKARWAKIQRPGRDIPDSPAARERYVSSVLAVQDGEPVVTTPRAKALLGKVRSKLAEIGSIDASKITTTVKDGAATMRIASGTLGGLSIQGRDRYLGACSEMFLANSLIQADATHEPMIAAGVHGLLCVSDGCAGVFDFRPTSGGGGGIYWGEQCMSVDEALALEMGKR